MLKRIAVLVLCIIFIFGAGVYAETGNIVQNPGFEEGAGEILEGWSTYSWNRDVTVSEFKLDNEKSHSGARSACITSSMLNDARYTQEIAVEPGAFYRLSCWIKTENVGEEGKGANLSIEGTLYNSRGIYGTSGSWEYVELYGKSGSNQSSFVLTAGLGGYSGESLGKAWFDDISVERVASVPEGTEVVNLYWESGSGGRGNASGSTGASGSGSGLGGYGTGMVVYTAIFLLSLYAVYFFMKDGRLKIKPANEKNILYVLLGAGLLIRLIMALQIEGFPSDISCFKAWALAAAEDLPGFYSSGIFVDYPPLYIYVLFFLGKLAALPGIGAQLTLLVKLPSIAADLITAYILYRSAKKHLPDVWCLLIAAAYALNPAVLADSALWGQVDSFFTMLVLGALMLLMEGRTGVSTALFSAAVLMKPQGIFFLPVLLFELIRKKSFREFLRAAAAGLVTAAAIILPFSFTQHPLWIFKLYLNTASGYTSASLNAFNLFSLFGANLKDDSTTWLLLGYRTWGLILAVLLVLFTGFLYLKGRHNSLPVFSALLLNAGAFILVTRMHERYMFPVIALSLLLFIYLKDRRIVPVFASVTMIVFLNIHTVLNRMLALGNPHIPPGDFLLRAASLANVLVFAYLLKIAYDTMIADRIIPVFVSTQARGDASKLRAGAAGSGSRQGIGRGIRQYDAAKLVNPTVSRLLIDRKDIMIMACMTIVYLAVSLVNLGGFKAPNTSWQPARTGESFMIDLGKEADISRLCYYFGVNDRKYNGGSYKAELIDASGNITSTASISKGDIYAWEHVKVTGRARKIKITVNSPGKTLNELVIVEAGRTEPMMGISIGEKHIDSESRGSVENLFDEQDMFEYARTLKTSVYFDEIYHARTAYEHLNRIEPYESTHPPLGKIIISLGILVAGMNPFGWRIAGVLFGAAMIPLMYLFGKKMFEERFYAFCAAFLMMFDFMHFVQSRIATIDTYGVFFIILMYYFMYDSFINKSYALGFKQSLRPLFLSGLFFGIGAACKWIALYGGAGLAFLFFLAKYFEYRDYLILSNDRKYKAVPWLKQFFSHYIVRTMLFCVLFFVVIPAVIYLLSYIPFMMVPGPGHGIKDIFPYQISMYRYHAGLVADHGFKSEWWSWPFIWKPIWFYTASDLPAGRTASIVSMGNPAIWWAGVAAVIAAAYISVKKRDRKMLVIFAAMVFQYVPWIFVSRLVFIYHFYSTVPFVILAMVYVIKYIIEKRPSYRYAVWAYLGVVVILFVMFYPVLSGLEVDKAYVENFLRWFKDRWYF